MKFDSYDKRLDQLKNDYQEIISKSNAIVSSNNGVYSRWQRPIITTAHIPYFWKYNLDKAANPLLVETMGINATFNAGAIFHDNKYILCIRVEGNDRKSFFALAESPNGVDNFVFRDKPIDLPQTETPDVNVYDMRLVAHEDGWIYGLFCTERKDDSVNDTSTALANCGIVRTKDLQSWERLPDLESKSNQQRNVVLHPEFINGEYALYTRPQDGFITVGKGGGIGWALTKDMTNPVISDEDIIDNKHYHTIKELKNGQGPAPIKTKEGWLHLAHGVRNTAAGLRYVLYMFMTKLDEPWKIIHAPSGHVIAPQRSERIGDVSNVVFSNGWIANQNDEVFIYYASSDTRMHVATSTVDRLVHYCKHTPTDKYHSHLNNKDRIALIDQNLSH